MEGACVECSQESAECIRLTQEDAPETTASFRARGRKGEVTPEEPRGCKKIVIHEDTSLPKAMKITIGDKHVELGEGETKGTRVKVMGRIHRLRQQKQATFIILFDGHDHLQRVLSGDLTKIYDALTFAQGTSLILMGETRKILIGQSSPGNREMHVDYYKVIGTAPTDRDAITNRMSAEQNQWGAQCWTIAILYCVETLPLL